MQLDIPVPVVAFLIFVVIVVGLISSWQYSQALKKQGQQIATADKHQRQAQDLLEDTRQQQERSAALLDRYEALLSRVERLVQRLEDRFST
jgi:Tfp pilus assembly protein PilO